MPRNSGTSRRGFLRGAGLAAGTLALSGCDSLSQAPWFRNILFSAERLTVRVSEGARSRSPPVVLRLFLHHRTLLPFSVFAPDALATILT